MNAITPKAIMSLELYKNLNFEIQAAVESTNYSQPTASSVLDKKLLHKPNPIPKFDVTPSYLYFYNIRFGSDARLTVQHTLYYEEGISGEIKDRIPIEHGRVPEIVEGLIGIGGSTGATTAAEPFGGNFRNNSDGATRHWDRVSYLAFLIDHPNWSFCDGSNGEPLPAVFGLRGNASGNHCFFDGAVTDIGNGPTKRSLFYCINHLRDIGGKRPPRPLHETFKYDLNTKFEFGNGFDPVILIFDPGGDNQGPPVPPPDLP